MSNALSKQVSGIGQTHAQLVSAVDLEDAACDVVGVVAGQVDHGAADIARRAQTAPWDVVSGALKLLLGCKLPLAGRVDIAGVDDVDVDSVRGQLSGKRSAEMIDSSFGHVV